MNAFRLLRLSLISASNLLSATKCVPKRLPPRLYMSSETNSTDSPDAVVAQVAEYIKQNDAKRVVVLVGAGISTASGIPDFRTPGSGLYDNLARYNLPWPEAVFDLHYFYSNPKPFYTLAKELYPSGRYRPNLVHYFIRLLHEQSRLLRVYTQNIDSLERMAGIPEEKLVEAHGTFLTATCTGCGAKAPKNLVKDAIDRGEVAKCKKCSSVIKPDIVFFGENLPDRFWEHRSDMLQTDLVFVMGTSLEVHPFAGVADVVSKTIPRVLFNRDLVGTFRFGLRPLDLAVLGEVTQSVNKLAIALNWKSDLDRLVKRCEEKSKSNNTIHSSSSSGRKINNNVPARHCCTSVTPHLTARLHSLSISRVPGQMKRSQNKESSPADRWIPNRSHSQPRSFRKHQNQLTITHQTSAASRLLHPSASPPLAQSRSASLRRNSSQQQKIVCNASIKPEPRHALTILRSYIHSSPAHTSDSDSTDSAYSFLSYSLSTEKNTSTMCSILPRDDRFEPVR